MITLHAAITATEMETMVSNVDTMSSSRLSIQWIRETLLNPDSVRGHP